MGVEEMPACQSRVPDADREAVAMVTAAPGIWGLYLRWAVGDGDGKQCGGGWRVNMRQEPHK